MSPHNKTVTSLGLASRGSRLVTGSLDRQLKFHSLSTFETVHSVAFPSPVLTLAVAVTLLFV
jgi:U3 small nucleolar RNA-associated protein 15